MNYYSFDVFDTCLCRLCGEPRLMFDVLSLKVQQAMGESCNEHMRQLFVVARVNAGGRNLTDIYNNVAKYFPIPYSVEQMAELELQTESEMLVPILATRELLDRVRDKGKVMFISDMYLPSSFIKERLEEFGFFKEGDLLFVSDELQAWKYDGSLYKYVHESVDVDFRHWHHYGDNRESDFREPRRLGIHAHHIHYDYLPYEEQWMRMPVLGYQYSAILAGVARAVRLSTEAPEDQKAFVCDISAPLMASWVRHIMDDAQSRGIKRLYFCARDMHSFFLIAKLYQNVISGVEVKYLFISGSALYKDNLCFDYLCSQGFSDGVPSAIVDSCSSGKTLAELNKVLLKNGCNTVDGYFWGRLVAPNVGASTGYFEMDNEYLFAMTKMMVSRLLGMRIIYELLFSVNYHLKTYGYEYHKKALRPVLRKDKDDDFCFEERTIREVKKSNDRLVCSFAKAFHASGIDSFSKTIFDHVVIPTYVEFVDRPQKVYLNYLHVFKWWNSPFVGNIRGKKRGVWKRGSYFYRLPVFIASPIRFFLSRPKLRSQLNQLISWKNRK